jgi:pyruvate dehydrogenase complex dehydrogenase (E1) component
MTPQKIFNDIDCTETQEWLEAFEAIVEREGAERAKFILQALKCPCPSLWRAVISS